jgi:protein TonB
MTAYVQDSTFLTRRGAVLAAIVALHVFVIWALASGLARRAMELVAPPISADIVEEVKKQDLPPPPPPPEIERPPVEVPPPDVTINVPTESTNAIQDVTDKPVARPPPKPQAAVASTGLGPGKGFPNPDDFYPSSAQRLGQTGSAAVHICIGPDGKLSEEPKVEKSSGTSSLDEAAIRFAKAASGHFRPATEDGKPVTKCATLPVKFKLK